MQWLSAPKFTEMLSKVLPTLAEHAAADDIDFSVLPWAVSEQHTDIQRELRARMVDLPNHIGVFLRDSPEARSITLSGQIAESAGELLKVDHNLKEVRYRIVPRVVAEQNFWGRYFKACRDIRRELLPDEPPEPNFSDCTGSSATDASSTRISALHAPPAAAPIAAAARNTRASAVGRGKSKAASSKDHCCSSASAPKGRTCEIGSESNQANDSTADGSASVTTSSAPVPEHRRESSHDNCEVAAAQWPDMTGRSITCGVGLAARALSDVARWRTPIGLAIPRRYLISGSNESPPEDESQCGLPAGEPQSIKLATWLTQGWMQPPPPLPYTDSQPASGPPSSRSGRITRAASSATICSEGGYSDWSRLSDQFAPIARELSAATATWHFVDHP